MTRYVTNWVEDSRRLIEEQLVKLRRRKGRPFVVVTDTTTGKFVQFVGSATEPLLLDLPLAQILTPAEIKAATELLGEPHRGRVGKRSSREFVTFHAGPFESPGDAAQKAVEVLERVFDAEGRDIEVELDLGGA
jgi:hypothetical protein